MAKKNSPEPFNQNNGKQTGENFGYKPFKIGPLLEQKAEQKNLNSKQIAALLPCDYRNVYKIFQQTMLSLPKLLRWSEILDENLLLLYSPNVKPLPNPLQAELDKQKAYVKDLEARLANYEKLLMENKSLKDQVKVLLEAIAKLKGA